MTHSDLARVAKQSNGPVYVYVAAKIQSQYYRLKKAFSGVKKTEDQLRL